MLIWTFSTRSYIYGNLYKNRVNISSGSGQSDASITIGQLTMADNGTYECSVSLMADLDGTSKSRVRLLVLGECPRLLPGWQEAGGAGGGARRSTPVAGQSQRQRCHPGAQTPPAVGPVSGWGGHHVSLQGRRLLCIPARGRRLPGAEGRPAGVAPGGQPGRVSSRSVQGSSWTAVLLSRQTYREGRGRPRPIVGMLTCPRLWCPGPAATLAVGGPSLS